MLVTAGMRNESAPLFDPLDRNVRQRLVAKCSCKSSVSTRNELTAISRYDQNRDEI